MFSQLFEFGILLGLPTIFVGVASSVAWSQLSKPWVFIVACLIMLYVLYSAMFYFAAPTVVSMDLIVPTSKMHSGAGNATGTLQEQKDTIWFPFLRAYVQPILLFSLSAIPLLWLAVKLFRK
jgi:hypothetical protein